MTTAPALPAAVANQTVANLLSSANAPGQTVAVPPTSSAPQFDAPFQIVPPATSHGGSPVPVSAFAHARRGGGASNGSHSAPPSVSATSGRTWPVTDPLTKPAASSAPKAIDSDGDADASSAPASGATTTAPAASAPPSATTTSATTTSAATTTAPAASATATTAPSLGLPSAVTNSLLAYLAANQQDPLLAFTASA